MVADQQWWKVGELAKGAGVTVRALHHYERIGLLAPSRHSDSGQRLYDRAQIMRLQQIVALKQLGLNLKEIRSILDGSDFRPDQILRLRLERLRQEMRLQQELCRRLEQLCALADVRQELSTAQWLETIGVMKMVEKHFTAEQLQQLKQRQERLGAERIREVQEQWPTLIAHVRTHLEQGSPPESPEVQALAKRWKELVDLFTGGDPEMERSAAQYYHEHPDRALEFGIDQELWRYIAQAMSGAP